MIKILKGNEFILFHHSYHSIIEFLSYFSNSTIPNMLQKSDSGCVGKPCFQTRLHRPTYSSWASSAPSSPGSKSRDLLAINRFLNHVRYKWQKSGGSCFGRWLINRASCTLVALIFSVMRFAGLPWPTLLQSMTSKKSICSSF
jgi:hypothetical protein